MDTQLKNEWLGFMQAFEWTFGHDWNHGQAVLGIPDNLRHGDFLDPEGYPDWGSHRGLIENYERLKRTMAAQNVSTNEPS